MYYLNKRDTFIGDQDSVSNWEMYNALSIGCSILGFTEGKSIPLNTLAEYDAKEDRYGDKRFIRIRHAKQQC